MPRRITAAMASCTLSLGVLASGAGVAAAAPSASAIDARAAAVDRCSYQVVRSDDSRYAYSVRGVVAGSARELPVQKEDFVRFSGGWLKVAQVDACSGGQGPAPETLSVVGKLENPEYY
ncbi:hypothetical protein, partial [Streptomyces rimosus]